MSREQLTQQEKDEIFLDATEAFGEELITEQAFKEQMFRIGMNAKDTEDMVKIYRRKGLP